MIMRQRWGFVKRRVIMRGRCTLVIKLIMRIKGSLMMKDKEKKMKMRTIAKDHLMMTKKKVH
jgi:hypothetical protein